MQGENDIKTFLFQFSPPSHLREKNYFINLRLYIWGRPYITYTLREGGWVAVGCTLMYCGGWVGSALMYVLIMFKEF